MGGGSWGRLGGLLVIVGMTALPFVSCGPITFSGHHIVRNKVPDFADLESGFAGMAERMRESIPIPDMPEGADATVTTTSDTSKAPKQIFEGGDLWLWFFYLGLLGLGVLGLIAKDGIRALVGVGIGGVVGIFFWIRQFESALMAKGGSESGLGESGISFNFFEADIGAWLGYAGFVLIAIGGGRGATPARTYGTSASNDDAWRPPTSDAPPVDPPVSPRETPPPPPG